MNGKSMLARIQRIVLCAVLTEISSAPVAAEDLQIEGATGLGELVPCARMVLLAIVEEAGRPRESHSETIRSETAGFTHSDQRAEQLIRAAARSAAKLGDRQLRARAFVLAIGVGLDDSELLRRHIVTRQLWQQLESEQDRKKRIAVLGRPTINGRSDLLHHFCVSASLCAVLSPDLVEKVGLLKESQDSTGVSGFSFKDYCANLAGIELANQVLSSPDLLLQGQFFSVADYVPNMDSLEDRLSAELFRAKYGSISDTRFLEQRARIIEVIAHLPAYQRKPERQRKMP